MSSPLTENLGLPLLHLAQISTSNFPSLQTAQNRPPEANLDRLLQGQFTDAEPQLRLQRLIQHSMDAELFGNSRQHSAGEKIQAALVKGMQKQVSAYVITQEQRSLISSSTQSFGYA